MTAKEGEVTAADRAALLRHGIAVLEVGETAGSLRLAVAGAGQERVLATVANRFGDEVEVDWLGELPRRLQPLRCRGHMEREPGRLQLRFALCGDEHVVDEITVVEDESSVVVFATVCTSVAAETGEWWEGPWHVYLDEPLGDRTVIDGTCGRAVPYKNVWAELEAEDARDERRRGARSRRRDGSGCR